MRPDACNWLVSTLDIHPILIDIGASGAPPAIWEEIAQHSIYVGFDPDKREIQEVSKGRFHKAIIANEAITSEKGSNQALFYLTKSPYCSSTLKPDSESLSNFLFSDLFEVEREAIVPAGTLDSVLDRLSLSRIDWFKTDSQGTDLRIFNSLREQVRSRVLAIDIEPGLIDAYVGEDLFVEAHKDLTHNGFWLSNLRIGTAVRMRRSTLHEVMAANKDINDAFVEKNVRKSPAYCEARYLRTIESLARGGFSKRDYALLWIFSLLDNQLGFALDLAIEYRRAFGADNISQLMLDEPIFRMTRSKHRTLYKRVKSVLPIRMKDWLKNFVPRKVYL